MTPSRRIAFTALMVWTLAVTCLRAIRMPNDFAEAHWLLDYRFGFVRRGLVGELLTLTTGVFSIPVTENVIATAAFTAFAIFCFTLLYMSVRVAQALEWSAEGILGILVFLSSPFVVISAHLLGYYDAIVVVLGAWSIILLINRRPWLAAGLQGVAILVHENAVLIVLPVFAWTWFLLNRRHHDVKSPLLPRLLFALPLLAFGMLVASRPLLSTEFAKVFTEHLSTFPFVQAGMNTNVPIWLTQSFLEVFETERSQFIIRLTPMYSLGLAFSALVILSITVDLFRFGAASIESLTLVAICFLPLSLHLVAWDTERIWTYSTVCSFLALFAQSSISDSQMGASVTRLWCLFGLAINVVMGAQVMDMRSDRFTLATRLLLYAPLAVGVLFLLWQPPPLRAVRVTE